MDYVTSTDGTKIAYLRSGAGPALIVIGGSLADHHFYVPLANELARDFTVYSFDRRGRGQSGDTPPYAVAREVEDVNANRTGERASGAVWPLGWCGSGAQGGSREVEHSAAGVS